MSIYALKKLAISQHAERISFQSRIDQLVNNNLRLNEALNRARNDRRESLDQIQNLNDQIAQNERVVSSSNVRNAIVDRADKNIRIEWIRN